LEDRRDRRAEPLRLAVRRPAALRDLDHAERVGAEPQVAFAILGERADRVRAAGAEAIAAEGRAVDLGQPGAERLDPDPAVWRRVQRHDVVAVEAVTGRVAAEHRLGRGGIEREQALDAPEPQTPARTR